MLVPWFKSTRNFKLVNLGYLAKHKDLLRLYLLCWISHSFTKREKEIHLNLGTHPPPWHSWPESKRSWVKSHPGLRNNSKSRLYSVGHRQLLNALLLQGRLTLLVLLLRYRARRQQFSDEIWPCTLESQLPILLVCFKCSWEVKKKFRMQEGRCVFKGVSRSSVALFISLFIFWLPHRRVHAMRADPLLIHLPSPTYTRCQIRSSIDTCGVNKRGP